MKMRLGFIFAMIFSTMAQADVDCLYQLSCQVLTDGQVTQQSSDHFSPDAYEQDGRPYDCTAIVALPTKDSGIDFFVSAHGDYRWQVSAGLEQKQTSKISDTLSNLPMQAEQVFGMSYQNQQIRCSISK